MKKISLLLVSSLLIVCMAGSAMAETITFPGLSGSAPHTIYINPNGEDVTTITLHYEGFATGQHYAETASEPADSSKLLQSCLSPKDGNPSISTPWTSNNRLGDYYNTESSIYDCELNVKGTTGGVIYIFDTATGASYPVTVSVKADIPEFPTVALPVAAILGLVFIFGRKKEGL